MTATWRQSRGELSTGIRLVTGGLLPLIMATKRQNPMVSIDTGSAIGCRRIKARPIMPMTMAIRFILSKPPAMGIWPPAIHLRMKISKR